MDSAKLQKWADRMSPDEEAFFRELLMRLDSILGPWLTDEECQALMYLFLHNDLVFADGFSTRSSWFDSIGSYAAVASCFSRDPDMDWRAVRSDFTHDVAAGNFQKTITNLTSRLNANGSVQLVG